MIYLTDTEMGDYGEKSKELFKEINDRVIDSESFISLIVRFGETRYLDGYYDCRTEIRGSAL